MRQILVWIQLPLAANNLKVVLTWCTPKFHLSLPNNAECDIPALKPKALNPNFTILDPFTLSYPCIQK